MITGKVVVISTILLASKIIIYQHSINREIAKKVLDEFSD